MMGEDDVRWLLHRLAEHPVLPPTDRLPPNDESLHILLADLAAGERSRHGDLLCGVAAEHGIAPGELARVQSVKRPLHSAQGSRLNRPRRQVFTRVLLAAARSKKLAPLPGR